ncbi:serine hydrolase domain-containing protein [Hyphomonas sp. NPDC076900]|uniref:serine hydrolase domain-containing protein n=1 Tax=unclassified Hyphomonas TaxID=2630699 RepID=UPI003CFCD65B
MSLRYFAYLCPFILAACVQPGSISSGVAIPPASLQQSNAIFSELRETLEREDFSGVAAIAEDGELFFVSAHGLQDRERGIPNTVDTRFALASTAKVITAIAVMQLVERGEVELDEPIGRFLPDYPNTLVRERVTVRHLIHMRSGLGDIFDLEHDPSTNPLANHADYVRLFESEPLAFVPGEDFAYSNAGYILLGRIIEIASGQDFYAYVADNIFQPAGMRETGYDDEGRPGPRMAVGYRAEGFDGIPERVEEIEGRSLVPSASPLGGRGTAAGGGYSTVNDFAKLDQALRTNSLISEQSFSVIFGDGFVRGERNAGIAGGAPGLSLAKPTHPRAGLERRCASGGGVQRKPS